MPAMVAGSLAGSDGRRERVVDAVELADLGIGDVIRGRRRQLLADRRLQPEDVLNVLTAYR